MQGKRLGPFVTAAVGATIGISATFWATRTTPRPDPYAHYTPRPDVAPETNAALSFFSDMGNKQYRWTEADWGRIKSYATDETVSLALRTQAAYEVGEQAGCEKCLAEPRKSDWMAILTPWLGHENEYMRTCALHTLYAIGAPDPPSMDADPSEEVRMTWHKTYGIPASLFQPQPPKGRK